VRRNKAPLPQCLVWSRGRFSADSARPSRPPTVLEFTAPQYHAESWTTPNSPRTLRSKHYLHSQHGATPNCVKRSQELRGSTVSGLMKLTAGGAAGASFPRNSVARLNRFHVLDVAWIEGLCAIEHEREVGFGPDHRFDALGLLAPPLRPRQQIASGTVASGAATNIGEIECVHVDELQRVVVPFSTSGTVSTSGSARQVRANIRIRRIRVGSLDRLVVRGVNPRVVDDCVPALGCCDRRGMNTESGNCLRVGSRKWSLPSRCPELPSALLQRCWRVGILRDFGAKGFRFSCWERIMPFKILWGGG
jgi:hypothetical protein